MGMAVLKLVKTIEELLNFAGSNGRIKDTTFEFELKANFSDESVAQFSLETLSVSAVGRILT